MFQNLRHHIEQKFRDTPLVHPPFPHLIVEDFFLPAVYQSLLAANPFPNNVGAEWISAAEAPTKTTTPYWARKQINFHQNQVFQAAPEHLAFWEVIKQCFLGDDWFVKLIIARYPEHFLLRFGELAVARGFTSLLFKTRQLFHAVKVINSTVPNQRYGMQFQLYEPPLGLSTICQNPS